MLVLVRNTSVHVADVTAAIGGVVVSQGHLEQQLNLILQFQLRPVSCEGLPPVDGHGGEGAQTEDGGAQRGGEEEAAAGERGRGKKEAPHCGD